MVIESTLSVHFWLSNPIPPLNLCTLRMNFRPLSPSPKPPCLVGDSGCSCRRLDLLLSATREKPFGDRINSLINKPY